MSAEAEGLPKSEGLQALATLQTRGIAGNPGTVIAAATLVGLFAMSLVIMADLPILLAAPALILGIVFVLARKAGEMTVQLTESGIDRSVTPMLARFVSMQPRRHSFAFADMRDYRRDHDRSRFRGEVNFLSIRLSTRPSRVVIQDMGGEVDLAPFADAFEELAARHGIRKRHGFYQTVFARGLTALFALSAIVLSGFAALGMLSPTSLFRLLAIILPGTIYMIWRVRKSARTSS